MNKNTLATIVSNGTVKVTTCAIIATVIEVESSLDDSFLHSHDEEEIMNLVVVVSKAKEAIVSKGEDSNEEPSEFENEATKELQVP
jgi:hypothetical protein